MLNTFDRARRQPVWLALSTLWLDTEVTAADIAHIADVLHASGYDLATLRDIYLHEVAPVVCHNLRVAAGVWDGFDPAWLHERAESNALRPSRWSRFWHASRPGRWYLTYGTESHWREIEERLVHVHHVAAGAPPSPA